MKNIKYAATPLLVLAILLFDSSPLIAEDKVPVIPIEQTVQEMIVEIAPRFAQNASIIDKIVKCESGYQIASHDGGRGKNVTGIHNSTFDRWLTDYKKEQGETLNKDSTYDQIKMMSWAFSKGYASHWTTWRAYKNGGTYTFYSKLLKGTYTARCK